MGAVWRQRTGAGLNLATGARRRTYRDVAVAPDSAQFVVRLDDRPLRTPLGTVIGVPTRPLAEAIADEWRRQPATLDLEACPLTRIAGTALDLMPRQRTTVVAELAGYGETELVCHRAERPSALVVRQQAVWQPLTDWIMARYDAHLVVAAGIVPRAQAPAALAALARAVAAYDDWRLAALAVAVHAAGSLVIGLAIIEGRLDAAAAFDAAELDATFQIEAWGEDSEATRRRATVRADLDAAARFVGLLAPDAGGRA